MMPRNVEENVYVTIGFARGSSTWQLLQREAQDLDISVPHLLKVLLADRTAALEGHGRHLWFPREMDLPQTAHVVTQTLATPSLQADDPAARLASTAAAAADYWED